MLLDCLLPSALFDLDAEPVRAFEQREAEDAGDDEADDQTCGLYGEAP